MKISQAVKQSSDLILFWTAICLLLVTWSPVPIVAGIAGIPLVLYLPGAALVAAAGDLTGDIQGTERHVWAVAASIGLSIAGGLILNLTGGLTRSHWLIFIGALVVFFTLIGALVSVIRGSVDQSAIGSANSAAGPDRTSMRVRIRSYREIASLRQLFIFFLALIVCADALALSIRTESTASQEHFVQAWVLPKPVGYEGSSKFQVGIRNEMGDDRTFIVRVTVGPAERLSYTIPLKDGQSWTRQLSRLGDETVNSTVALSSKPRTVIQRVYLRSANQR